MDGADTADEVLEPEDELFEDAGVEDGVDEVDELEGSSDELEGGSDELVGGGDELEDGFEEDCDELEDGCEEDEDWLLLDDSEDTYVCLPVQVSILASGTRKPFSVL